MKAQNGRMQAASQILAPDHARQAGRAEKKAGKDGAHASGCAAAAAAK
jgi:hypothetical protein